MRVEDVEISDLQAIMFVESHDAWWDFLEENGLESSKPLKAKLYARYKSAGDEAWAEYERLRDQPRRSAWRGWRPDAVALTRFVETNPGMTLRMRQVFQLCFVEELSLDAAAERLRIGRETVRTHLRRLRAEARKCGALTELEPLSWEAQPTGSAKGRAPRYQRSA